jgi:hypothetical protein
LTRFRENVIVGRLIPAGTGMPVYREIFLEKDAPAQPSLEDLLQREEDEALTLADFNDEQQFRKYEVPSSGGSREPPVFSSFGKMTEG